MLVEIIIIVHVYYLEVLAQMSDLDVLAWVVEWLFGEVWGLEGDAGLG